jgi:hypothetical protein
MKVAEKSKSNITNHNAEEGPMIYLKQEQNLKVIKTNHKNCTQ